MTALDGAARYSVSRVAVVLSRPIYSRNVGMCARAAANMGAGRLILVAPRVSVEDEEAKQGAAGAQDPLRAATLYASWGDYLEAEPDALRIALSGKDGRLTTPDLLDERIERVRASNAQAELFDPDVPVHLVFGPENDGLSPQELEDCDHVCRLPTFGDFSSLNLSHACLLALFVVQKALGARPQACAGAAPESAARAALAAKRTARGSRRLPEAAIEEWLEELGFDLSNRRVHAANVLKRLMLENEPTADEVRVLEAVVRQTTRKLRERGSRSE